VILDICVPSGTGIDASKSIEKDRVTPIRQLRGIRNTARKVLQSGARFLLDKSSEFEKVSEVLRT